MTPACRSIKRRLRAGRRGSVLRGWAGLSSPDSAGAKKASPGSATLYSQRMSRALRYAPPLAGRDLILRPRLLASLRSRFERPLTAVVAAAGFGKTTLLTQAVQENALSPVGEDHWLTCQCDDAAVSFRGRAGGHWQAR